MDWRRITNRFKKGVPELNQEKKECELQGENEQLKEAESQKGSIEQYLNELLPELNLRLFLEMTGEEMLYANCSEITSVIKYPQKMLWAESITVTSYTDATNMHQTKRRIFNRLTGKRTKKKSFTLKKYKKERR